MTRIIAVLLIFSACSQQQRTDTYKQDAQEIIEADLAMSKLASEIGFLKALIAYADDSVIIARDGKLPLMSKMQLEKEWVGKPVVKELTWRPIKAQVAKNGDLGYSFGFAAFHGKDTTIYSNYCTIWLRQKDGSWKFVFDGGNNIPKPLK